MALKKSRQMLEEILCMSHFEWVGRGVSTFKKLLRIC